MKIRSATLSAFQSLLLLLAVASAASADIQLSEDSNTSSLRRNTKNINNNKDDNRSSRGLIVSRRRRPRIIGGESIEDPDRYPYFALMDGRSFCGAVLISSRFVLTAAHCVGADNDFEVGISEKANSLGGGGDYMSFLESWLTGGSTSRDGSDGEATTRQSQVVDYRYKTKKVHPDYNTRSLDADLALYELETDVAADLTPIRLEQGAITVRGTPLTAIGFGDTNPSNWVDNLSNRLQEVTVDYVTASDCQQDFGSRYGITSGMLCAFELGEDTCQGDSGGPLFLKGATPLDDRLVGLVSWGVNCGGSTPGVYTRISHYYDWIVENMCAMNSAAVPSYVDCDALGYATDTAEGNVDSGSGGVGSGEALSDDIFGAGLGLDELWGPDTGDDIGGGGGGDGDDLFGGGFGLDEILGGTDDNLGGGGGGDDLFGGGFGLDEILGGYDDDTGFDDIFNGAFDDDAGGLDDDDGWLNFDDDGFDDDLLGAGLGLDELLGGSDDTIGGGFDDDNTGGDDFLGVGLGLDNLLGGSGGGDDTIAGGLDDGDFDDDAWWNNDDFSDSSTSFIDGVIDTVAGWFGF